MRVKLRKRKRFLTIILITKEIMKYTEFRVEDIFGDIISKDKIRQNQTFKLNKFIAKMMRI